MSDLTDEQLDGMDMWERDPAVFQERSRPIWAMLVRSLVTEIRRHRAAIAADEELVRSVVRSSILQALEAYECGYNATSAEMVDHAATRAAKQLASAGMTQERWRLGAILFEEFCDVLGDDQAARIERCVDRLLATVRL